MRDEILGSIIVKAVLSAGCSTKQVTCCQPELREQSIVLCERIRTLDVSTSGSQIGICVDPLLQWLVIQQQVPAASSHSSELMLLHDRISDAKVQVLWDGMTMDIGVSNTAVRVGDVKRVVNQNAYLSLLESLAAEDLAFWNKSDATPIGYDDLLNALGLSRLTRGEQRGCDDDTDMELLLPLSHLRKHFRALSKSSGATRDGFTCVNVGKVMALVDQELRESPPLLPDDSLQAQHEIQNIKGVSDAVSKALLRAGLTEVTWPELQYLTRHQAHLSTPEVFHGTSRLRTLSVGRRTPSNPTNDGREVATSCSSVAQAIVGRESRMVFVLYFDGSLDVWTAEDPSMVSECALVRLLVNDFMNPYDTTLTHVNLDSVLPEHLFCFR